MNIYEALKKDHETVKDLLAQLVALNEDSSHQRNDLIEKIRDELIPHARAEETVFYNSLRSVDVAKDKVMHGYQEHMEAEAVLRGLQVRDKIDMAWKDSAIKLKKAIEHHIQEEETEIFPVARQLFTEEEAETMCEAFEKLKPQVKSEGFMQTSLDLITNLMPTGFAASLRTRKLDQALEKENRH